MEQAEAIALLVALTKSIKPSLKATEVEHEAIKAAIAALEVKPVEQAPAPQA